MLSPLLFAIYINELPVELERSGCGGVKVGRTIVRCLMFADDIVMMAVSARGCLMRLVGLVSVEGT